MTAKYTALVVALLIVGAFFLFVAQSFSLLAAFAVLGSISINISINLIMTKYNRASGEIKP